MREKYILITFLTLIIMSSCCTQKEFLTTNTSTAYKLVKQQRTFSTENRISFWKTEWIPQTKSTDSTHFIYQNFETFYVFTPDKIVKKLELRNRSTKNSIFNSKNHDEKIGTYTNCAIKIGSKKLMLHKKGLDTIILKDQVQSLESILVRVRQNN